MLKRRVMLEESAVLCCLVVLCWKSHVMLEVSCYSDSSCFAGSVFLLDQLAIPKECVMLEALCHTKSSFNAKSVVFCWWCRIMSKVSCKAEASCNAGASCIWNDRVIHSPPRPTAQSLYNIRGPI